MKYILCAASLAAGLALAGAAHAAPIYVNDFDSDTTASWNVNNNGNGTNAADFFFDYSTVGIPPAPNSVGGTTRGLKLSANISGVAPPGGASVLSGISVSPTGQSFTGNYKLKFDWWHNWLGAAFTPPSTGGIGSASGGSGSTQLSTFGVLTSGTTSNYVGVADSVFFAADGDGASTADYRIYSSQVQSSHQIPDPTGTAVHAAGSRNNTAAYYATPFPGGNMAPATQVGISATQSGTTLAGTAGFQWNQVVIEKAGNVVTWTVNGTLLATVDTTNFTTSTGGNNILFGQADTSNGAGTPANLFALLDFTLIDNVQVVPEPSSLVLCLVAALGGLVSRRRR